MADANVDKSYKVFDSKGNIVYTPEIKEPDTPEDPEEPDDNNDVPGLDDDVKGDNWLIALLKIIWNFIKSLFGIK